MYDGDCLDFYVADDIVTYGISATGEQHQIIPFCRRDRFENKDFEVAEGIPPITFADLHQRNTTIEQLYAWSVHLDLIEEYEAYQQDPVRRSWPIFHNCSSKSRFGRFCQYSFNSQVNM
jgi:hypothetical protein